LGILSQDLHSYAQMPRDIFISHTTADRTCAAALCDMLESKGLTCWIAPRNIEPGSNWTVRIMWAIAVCQIIMLLFSSKTNLS
jgi:hypothetical protein